MSRDSRSSKYTAASLFIRNVPEEARYSSFFGAWMLTIQSDLVSVVISVHHIFNILVFVRTTTHVKTHLVY